MAFQAFHKLLVAAMLVAAAVIVVQVGMTITDAVVWRF